MAYGVSILLASKRLDEEFCQHPEFIAPALFKLPHSMNAEVQTSIPAGTRQRFAYYGSSLYVGQLKEGQEYATLRPAISICVLDALMFPRLPDLHLDFRLRDARHGEVLTNDVQIHTIELPKYVPPCDNTIITDAFEAWIYFLRYAGTSTAEELRARLALWRFYPCDERHRRS